ncbi:hypothetical protein [Saliphagus infecundisoli]|uniref:Uncharacterized protein n=1 Tax=Saliphagus infecundisoli TaxID=1849069 RepID=A0ABD5QIZ0_9EURY|nr:hypothetical protein [Saliphagus infecundisoli]
MTETIDSSRRRRHDPDRRPDPLERLVTVLASADRYDLMLAVIPVVFGVALAIAPVAGVAVEGALVPAAVVAAAVVADACYLNPPIDPDEGAA